MDSPLRIDVDILTFLEVVTFTQYMYIYLRWDLALCPGSEPQAPDTTAPAPAPHVSVYSTQPVLQPSDSRSTDSKQNPPGTPGEVSAEEAGAPSKSLDLRFSQDHWKNAVQPSPRLMIRVSFAD